MNKPDSLFLDKMIIGPVAGWVIGAPEYMAKVGWEEFLRRPVGTGPGREGRGLRGLVRRLGRRHRQRPGPGQGGAGARRVPTPVGLHRAGRPARQHHVPVHDDQRGLGAPRVLGCEHHTVGSGWDGEPPLHGAATGSGRMGTAGGTR